MRRRKANGFTLIELLVVVGILAILIGVLMPVLASIRRNALITACAGNMRQIAHAVELYQADNHAIYPYAAFQSVTGSSNSEISFDDLLHKHLGGAVLSSAELSAERSLKPNRIWRCPEDDRERWFNHPPRTYVPTQTRLHIPAGTTPNSNTRMFSGFAGSEASNGPSPLFHLSLKPTDIRGSSEFITFVEYPATSNWQGSALRSSCSGPDQQSWFMPRGRTLHKTKWNYLFADGHVAALEAPKTIDPQLSGTLRNVLNSMALYNNETQPLSLPKYKLPLVSNASATATAEIPADTWWGGSWSDEPTAPKSANSQR